MRIIKLGLISVIAFSVLILLMSLFFPSHVRISKAINIQGSMEKIQSQLADTRQWKKWNEMVNDSLSHANFTDNMIRSDRLTIRLLTVKPGTITTSWNQKGRQVNSGFNIIQSGPTSVVQWYFDFHLRWYPWEKFGSIILDKQIGIPMEKSLNNLKQLVENLP